MKRLLLASIFAFAIAPSVALAQPSAGPGPQPQPGCVAGVACFASTLTLTGALTAPGGIHLGASTSGFPFLKASTTTTQFRLGDDSGFASLQAFAISFNNGSALSDASGNGIFNFVNASGSVMTAMNFGNAASTNPQLRVNGNGLDMKNGDNSAFTQFKAGALAFGGTIPVPTGTGTPTIVTGSTDNAGEVTSGATATSLIITFAVAKTNAPFCTVTPQTQLVAFAYTISTTAITITQTATTGEKIDYICVQH